MIEPTGYTALDLIGFTDRGAYAANVNYVKNDLVHHGGNIWRVLIDDTIGITPADGPNYTIFMGDPTNLIERIIAPLEDNPATVAYQTGRQIIYNDHLYEVIQNIGVGDILIAYEDDPTNANIKLASPMETQVLALNASKVNKSDVVNNVTTTAAGKVLDARQGKTLQDAINAKVNKSDVVNNVTTTAAGKVLDARQGKVLQDGINTVETQVLTLNTKLTASEGQISNIKNKIKYDAIKDRNIMFFSDSFDLFNPGVSWCARVAELLGVNSYHKYSKNGGGFIGNSTDTAWVNGIDPSASWASDISDVIIVGGWNDRLHDDNALDAAAGGFFTQLRLAYPNVKRIYLGQSSYTNDSSANMTYSVNMFNRYSKIANKYGCIYLSGVENILRNIHAYFDAGQYVHPNPAGVEALSQGIATAVKSGCVNTSYHESISNCGSVTLDVAASSSGSLSADVFGNDKNSKIIFLSNLSFTVSETVNSGSSKQFLTLSDHVINMLQLEGITQVLLYVSPDGIAIPETVFPTLNLRGLQMYVNSKLETGKTYYLQRFRM